MLHIPLKLEKKNIYIYLKIGEAKMCSGDMVKMSKYFRIENIRKFEVISSINRNLGQQIFLEYWYLTYLVEI